MTQRWAPPDPARPVGSVFDLPGEYAGRASTPANAAGADVGGDHRQEIWRLYERRHADMVRFAAFLCGDVHAAEDIAQEAFVRLVDAWPTLEQPERAEGYVKVTIVNLVRGDYRRRKVAERRPTPHLSLVGSAEDDALNRVGRQHVLRAVAALPLRQRACVVMRHWMRMTETEIAETLELSVGSVRTHVKRGTESLKRTLGDQR